MTLFDYANSCFGPEKHLRITQEYVRAHLLSQPEVLTKMEQDGYNQNFIIQTLQNLSLTLEENNLLYEDTKELLRKLHEEILE